jgi:hypothetical protein
MRASRWIWAVFGMLVASRTVSAAAKPLSVRLRIWGGFMAPPWVQKLGVEMGATSIELWQDYRGFPTVPDAQLKRWAKMVEANDSP